MTALAWHPQHERLLASGGYDGKLMYWIVGWVVSFVLSLSCFWDARVHAHVLCEEGTRPINRHLVYWCVQQVCCRLACFLFGLSVFVVMLVNSNPKSGGFCCGASGAIERWYACFLLQFFLMRRMPRRTGFDCDMTFARHPPYKPSALHQHQHQHWAVYISHSILV